jgi:predicted ribosomally synthesized peptide with nif11-like leader
MSLEQLDAFLAHSRGRPELDARLHAQEEDPLDLEAFLALARCEGFAVEEADVLAALQREEANLSDAELQGRAAAEARRLRHFIPG